MNPNPVIVLKLAALAHLGLISAGVLMPRVTGLWGELAKIKPFACGLFRVYYAFIGLCLVSFGLGSWFLAPQLADGSTLARAVCGFLAVFWTIRLGAAIRVFDVRPFLTIPWCQLGYHALNAVFGTFPFVYGWLALRR
jgi:hypothetical protein